jgi:hypothetical protein
MPVLRREVVASRLDPRSHEFSTAARGDHGE